MYTPRFQGRRDENPYRNGWIFCVVNFSRAGFIRGTERHGHFIARAPRRTKEVVMICIFRNGLLRKSKGVRTPRADKGINPGSLNPRVKLDTREGRQPHENRTLLL
jgi:hypothetical protein